MREIVLDTETTGLDPAAGHRLVEIGCIELFNGVPTGRDFHRYVNPERDMPAEAEAVHGLSVGFLAAHPVFAAIVEEFLAFIEDATLIIHNAEFDMRFLNAELKRCARLPLPADRARCTAQWARRKFPGSPASLDALCRRFGIDTAHRTRHGALVDADLLAGVYLELIGGRQGGLDLAVGMATAVAAAATQIRAPRRRPPSVEEQVAHAAFVATLKNPIWRL